LLLSLKGCERMYAQWQPALDTQGLFYHIINVLHTTTDGLELQYHGIIETAQTSVLLSEVELESLASSTASTQTLVLVHGMKLAIRMRSIYNDGSTRVLAGRVQASPANIHVRDISEPPLLQACSYVNAAAECSGAVAPFACSAPDISSLSSLNAMGSCVNLPAQNLSCSFGTPFSISFAWSPPPTPASQAVGDAISLYEIELRTTDDPTLSVNATASSELHSLRFSNLQTWVGLPVSVRIRAVDFLGPGKWAEVSAGVVPGEAEAPEVHMTSGADMTGSSSSAYVLVRVHAAGDPAYATDPILPIIRYDIQISFDSAEFSNTCLLQTGMPIQPMTYGSSTYSHRYRGLNVGRTYYARARTVTAVGPGKFSHTVVKTLVVAPSPPRNVQYLVASGRITVTWQAPLDEGCGEGAKCKLAAGETEKTPSALMYHLSLLEASGGSLYTPPKLDELSSVMNSTTESSFLVVNVTKDRKYWVHVRAENTAAQGVSKWSDPVLVESIGVPSLPRSLRLEAFGDLALRATWLRPEDTGAGNSFSPLERYDLEMVALNESTSHTHAHMIEHSHEHVFSEYLRQLSLDDTQEAHTESAPVGVPIMARIRSVNRAGSSNWSDWTRPATALHLPSAPRNLSVFLSGNDVARSQPEGSTRIVKVNLLFQEPEETGLGPQGIERESILYYSVAVNLTICPAGLLVRPADYSHEIPHPPSVDPLIFRVDAGCAYDFKVRAYNHAGAGPTAIIDRFFVVVTASAPRDLSVTLPFATGRWGLSVKWEVPKDPGDGLDVTQASIVEKFRLITSYHLEIATSAAFAPGTLVHEAVITDALGYSLDVAPFIEQEKTWFIEDRLSGQTVRWRGDGQPITWMHCRLSALNAMGRSDYSHFSILPQIPELLTPSIRIFDAPPAVAMQAIVDGVLTGQSNLTAEIKFATSDAVGERDVFHVVFPFWNVTSANLVYAFAGNNTGAVLIRLREFWVVYDAFSMWYIVSDVHCSQ
jgi:hypothetical protein